MLRQSQPQSPFTHAPVQQSSLTVHAAPVIAQLAGTGWHASGMPPHRPSQQSSFVAHEAPVAVQAEVQTVTPASFASQLPLQHVSPVLHGASRGKHGPGPNPHRPSAVSHESQHGGTTTESEQSSPAARHSVAERMHLPISDSHCPEQQSLSAWQVAPLMAQRAPPHWPPLQASEQQSDGTVQGVPSTRQ